MQPITELKQIFNNDVPKYWEFIGSGGKTSALINAVKLLSRKPRNILFTTTVHMAAPLCCAEALSVRNGAEADGLQGRFVDYPGTFAPFESYEDLLRVWQELKAPRLLMTGRTAVKSGVPKLTGLSSAEVDRLCGLPELNCLLIEADGSRQLPLKVHAEHEPVLFSEAEMGAAVVGLRGIGRKVCEGEVHRPELMRRLLNCGPEHIINEDDFIIIVVSYLDKLPTPAHTVIFSQAEGADEALLRRLAARVKGLRGGETPLYFIVQAHKVWFML